MEAWPVDALNASDFTGELESVFARGQVTAGIAMLSGSVAGGVVAQATNLAVPYILRATLLALTLIVAFVVMRDIGFSPQRGGGLRNEFRTIVRASIDGGLRNRPVRWLMLAAPFTGGVGVYAFYAMQPYLLELYGDQAAFGIAGLAAAIVAGAQIAGGLAVPAVRRAFKRRTTVLLIGAILSVAVLAFIGWTSSFWVAISLLVVWAMVSAASLPIRQSYVNQLIPSEQRAIVLSFDSLMGSGGGVFVQPVLGRAADIWSYSTSYLIGAVIQAAAIPFVALAKRERASSDVIEVSK